MANARVNTAAIRVMPADDDVIDSDQRGEHAHRRDKPERTVTGDGKGKADHIGFARAPVTIKNGRSARRIDVSRPIRRDSNHRYNFCFRESWSGPRRGSRGLPFQMPTRLADGL